MQARSARPSMDLRSDARIESTLRRMLAELRQAEG
jgi:hypothetical protein